MSLAPHDPKAPGQVSDAMLASYKKHAHKADTMSTFMCYLCSHIKPTERGCFSICAGGEHFFCTDCKDDGGQPLQSLKRYKLGLCSASLCKEQCFKKPGIELKQFKQLVKQCSPCTDQVAPTTTPPPSSPATTSTPPAKKKAALATHDEWREPAIPGPAAPSAKKATAKKPPAKTSAVVADDASSSEDEESMPLTARPKPAAAVKPKPAAAKAAPADLVSDSEDDDDCYAVSKKPSKPVADAKPKPVADAKPKPAAAAASKHKKRPRESELPDAATLRANVTSFIEKVNGLGSDDVVGPVGPVAPARSAPVPEAQTEPEHHHDDAMSANQELSPAQLHEALARAAQAKQSADDTGSDSGAGVIPGSAAKAPAQAVPRIKKKKPNEAAAPAPPAVERPPSPTHPPPAQQSMVTGWGQNGGLWTPSPFTSLGFAGLPPAPAGPVVGGPGLCGYRPSSPSYGAAGVQPYEVPSPKPTQQQPPPPPPQKPVASGSKSKQGAKPAPDELSRLKQELAQSRKRERDQMSINEKLVGESKQVKQKLEECEKAYHSVVADRFKLLAHAKAADIKCLEHECHKSVFCFKNLQLQDMVLAEYIEAGSAHYNEAIANAYTQCDMACDVKTNALKATLKEKKAKLEEQYKQWESVMKQA